MKTDIIQIYDIARAFIADKGTVISKKTENGWITEYKMRNGILSLGVYAPHGAPSHGTTNENSTKKEGSLILCCGGKMVCDAHTRCNIGRAMGKSKYNPVRIFTRMRAPHFFRLMDLCEGRVQNRIPTTDNTNAIHQKLDQINTRQK